MNRDLVSKLQTIHDVLTEKCQGPVKTETSVYLADALQSVTSEILEAVGRQKMDQDGTITITKEDLQKAAEEDAELSRLFQT